MIDPVTGQLSRDDKSTAKVLMRHQKAVEDRKLAANVPLLRSSLPSPFPAPGLRSKASPVDCQKTSLAVPLTGAVFA